MKELIFLKRRKRMEGLVISYNGKLRRREKNFGYFGNHNSISFLKHNMVIEC
jgi:hypothetical protein